MKVSVYRIYVYLILILLISSATAYWVHTGSSLSENFFAGAIELFVTVGLLDTLFTLERASKLKKLNESPNKWVKTSSGIAIAKFMASTGCKIKNTHEFAEQDVRKMESDIHAYLNGNDFNKYMLTVQAGGDPALRLLEQSIKDVEDYRRVVFEALDRISPKIDPEVYEFAFEEYSQVVAFLTVLKELVDAFKQSGADIKGELLQNIWLDKSPASTLKFRGSIQRFLGAMNFLREKAEQNKLGYDI